MGVTFELHRDPAVFWDLAEEWMALLQTLPFQSPFLSPYWVGVSHEYFWRFEELSLITLRENGALAGVAPIGFFKTGGTVRARFVTEPAVTDYADFIVGQKHRALLIGKSIQAVREEAGGDAVILDLRPLRGDSPTIWAFENLAAQNGLRVRKFEETRAPYLELPDSFDAYLYKLRKKDRHELRRKLSRIQRLAEVNFEVFRTPQEVAEHLDDFFRLFALSCPEKREFLTPGIEAFFREVFVVLARQGWVRLYFLRADGWRVAAFLTLDYGDTLFVYNSGFDPQAAELSPGIVLIARIIEEAIAEGKKKLDFLRGQEEYKYRLGAKDVPIYRLVAGETIPESVEKEHTPLCSESLF